MHTCKDIRSKSFNIGIFLPASDSHFFRRVAADFIYSYKKCAEKYMCSLAEVDFNFLIDCEDIVFILLSLPLIVINVLHKNNYC